MCLLTMLVKVTPHSAKKEQNGQLVNGQKEQNGQLVNFQKEQNGHLVNGKKA